jgi:two-component system response regulator PilR (NtrC family)
MFPFVGSELEDPERTKEVSSMKRERTMLIVSCRPENRKTLVRMFDELSINSYVAPTIRDARELLGSRSLSMVFCEERLSDGSYCDLLRDVRATWPETGFVVLLCTGEREEYLQAMRLGAQEVLRSPLRPTDVDLVLIQAMKESDRKEMTANA